jgi:8-oxo-dGTP diphosphatase
LSNRQILTVEIFAHLDAGDRRLWQGDLDERPLSELGRDQAQALCEALAVEPVDALYSSPALRCRESLEPLARRFGLPVGVLPELRETDGWLLPPAWPGPYEALGGAFAAGRAMAALAAIRAVHATGRVVVCTHGDVLPALAAYLAGAFALELPPPHATRGGWYSLTPDAESIELALRDVLPGFPLA